MTKRQAEIPMMIPARFRCQVFHKMAFMTPFRPIFDHNLGFFLNKLINFAIYQLIIF